MPVAMKYGAGGGVGGRSGSSFLTLLWTNPNPTSSFAAQTISINLNAYSWFAVHAKFSNASPSDLPLAIFPVDDNDKRIQSAAGGNNRVGSRTFHYDTENKTMTFDAANYNSAANNNSVIPLAIYGVSL